MVAIKPVILTENLTKYYHKKPGIIDVNLEVNEGEVFGYLGPNGAGKTTTIRLLLNFIIPTMGRGSVLSRDIIRDSIEVRRHTGYLSGNLTLYSDLTGEEFLRYAAHLRGGVDWKYVKQLSDRLQCELSIRINALSQGNRQKIGLIQAFMHCPSLLILDEPTLGLDPLIQQEFYRMINEAKDNRQTVFMSSHVLPEVERICDRVGIVREGRLVAIESIPSLKSHALRQIEIRFGQPVPPDKFIRIKDMKDISVQNDILRCTVIGDLDTLIKTAAEFSVIDIISREPTLEDVFLTYYNKVDKNV